MSPENELDQLIKSCQKCSLLYRKEQHKSTDTVLPTKYNLYIVSIFKSFLNGVLLKTIPASLHLYPDKKVISCDVAGLMQDVLGSHDQDQADSQSQSCGSTPEEFSLLCERKQFVEDVVDAPIFLDLITRHGVALHFFTGQQQKH
jgi:hypothetical protein